MFCKLEPHGLQEQWDQMIFREIAELEGLMESGESELLVNPMIVDPD